MEEKRHSENICELCGKKYNTYAIILSCNPLSIAAFYEDEQKPDGTFRSICKECRTKEDKEKTIKYVKEQLGVENE
jgi:hypothetical protein